MTRTYAFPPGGLPAQTEEPAQSGAIFTEAYAFIPAAVQCSIVTSLFPGWEGAHGWILARPLSGFAETFAQYAMEVTPGGGSTAPDPDPGSEAALLIVAGEATITIAGEVHVLTRGGYAYVPPRSGWTLRNAGTTPLRFHWIRKRWQPAPGLTPPDPVIASDAGNPVHWMENTDLWGTTRFHDPADLRHDMHVNIVTFRPGGRIPLAETHVMEHGLYVLQGTARYLLNRDWVTVGPGDFMWLRAFCPQACFATGSEDFRYLLYKDVNRHPSLSIG
ncbi:MAG: (S)-ureidoglycine aminohydrolase [Rubellimicrobium sp.]|nr:(S)-ureidoglycine aminohydrolase [Rubellimicrobium sp.]